VRRPGLSVTTVRGFTAARDTVETLRRDLLDDRAQVRADAVYDLSFLPSDRSLPDLLVAAADPDERVRDLVARGLGRLGDEAGLRTLVHLMGDPVPSVRAAAVDAVVLFANRATPLLVEEVTRLTTAEPAGLRLESALTALGRVGDERAPAPVSTALRDGGSAARAAAARALGDLGLSEGIPALRAALADPVPEVREAAARSIVAIAGPAAREVIEDYIARETDLRLKERAGALLRR